jgi:hypothetical protein
MSGELEARIATLLAAPNPAFRSSPMTWTSGHRARNASALPSVDAVFAAIT